MRTLRGFVILAACLAATMAVPVENRAAEAVTRGINQFSSAFFAEVGKGNSGNLIISPFSTSLALSMTAYGSSGKTKEEFEQVLHIPGESVGRTVYANLIDSLNAAENVELRLANKVYVNNHFTVKPTFQELTQAIFRSTSQNLDFAQSEQAANTINQWVEEQTNYRIRDLVEARTLDADTAIVLVNALYFKGNWTHKFNARRTRDKPFHVTKDLVKNVPTMYQLAYFKYGVLPELQARFIELPYEGEEQSMVIILPDEIDGLAQLEEKLAQKDLIELIKTGEKVRVALHLPKFKIESTFELKEYLQNLGLVKAFDRYGANFEGISDTPIAISSVAQKAFIDVNERGTEAAAATDIKVIVGGAIPAPRVEFDVDRPYLAAIVGDNLTFFVARIADPSVAH